MIVNFDLNSVDSYRLFLKVKSLPRYRIVGRTAVVPDEYAALLGMTPAPVKSAPYEPEEFLFDYQRDIARLAVRKKKFGLFITPGWGKTNIWLSYLLHAKKCLGPSRNLLIVSPLMIIDQTIEEANKFWGQYQIEQVAARDLQSWMKKGDGIGITNYEAIRDNLDVGRLGCLLIAEASMLKSSYGKWGMKLIDMGKGLEWKLTETGTPAPNDRIEYANQAVFLDAFPTVNSFYARFFVNRGQTGERWELKPHAMEPFYRSLSDFSIFMNDPASFGWKDNVKSIPPIEVHIPNIELTEEQYRLACKFNGSLIASTTGGVGSRARMSQLAKGHHKGERIPTNKPLFIRTIVDEWIAKESTIIWCQFDREQDEMEKTFPESVSMRGSTPYEDRASMMRSFKSGEKKVFITKSKVCGMGLNLQICTRMIFNGVSDSYESYAQCVKRSNRVGSTKKLHVYIPTTELERPFIDNVLRKAKMVDEDAKHQEELFKKVGFGWRSAS